MGDLYDKRLNLKATYYLSIAEIMNDLRDSLMHASSKSYLPFYLPEDLLISRHQVNFLWMDESFNVSVSLNYFKPLISVN